MEMKQRERWGIICCKCLQLDLNQGRCFCGWCSTITFFIVFVFFCILHHLVTGVPQYIYYSKETRIVLFSNQQALIFNGNILNNEVCSDVFTYTPKEEADLLISVYFIMHCLHSVPMLTASWHLNALCASCPQLYSLHEVMQHFSSSCLCRPFIVLSTYVCERENCWLTCFSETLQKCPQYAPLLH